MSDRGLLFLFSLVMIVASLAACGGLIVTGQAATIDGLFLLLTCGAGALAFALYVWFLIGQAQQPPEAAKPGAKKPAAE